MSDFVKRENLTTSVTDTHVVLIVEYPNGTKRQLKIEKDVFINALKRLCKNV